MDEFELIRRYFDRQCDAAGVVVGIGDDGAVLQPAPDAQQVQVVDTLVEGVHFLPGTRPSDIAWRAVAVNLSDIAAMGATPRWMTLALTASNADSSWFESFSQGLFEIANRFDLALVGGDTTAGPQTVVTVHVTGEVAPGESILRSGARVGDSIFVTGTVGDAAAGLALLKQGKSSEYLSDRFLRPMPRLEIGRAIAGVATAAIDISDGLVGDLAKLLSASGVGGELQIDELPLSEEIGEHFDLASQQQFAMSGGDDYELCFTARAEDVRGVVGIRPIGIVTADPGLTCRHEGNIVQVDNSGYRHFP